MFLLKIFSLILKQKKIIKLITKLQLQSFFKSINTVYILIISNYKEINFIR